MTSELRWHSIDRVSRKLAVAFVSAWLMVSQPAGAIDMSGLYSTSTLNHWGNRYAENIRWNMRNSVWRELDQAERNQLGNLRLHFPLMSPRGDPFDYYTLVSSHGAVINMPVLSIKFFDDLAIAYAWLGAQGFDLQIPLDYVAMLKYLHPGDFPGGSYQAPLRAMRIPADALDNSSVDKLAQNTLKSAVTWILLHELGHAYHRHGEPGNALTAQIQEREADDFATEIMRRIGVAPAGMGFFFTATVLWWPNRSDCETRDDWHRSMLRASHPVTTDRLRRLANRIRQFRHDFVRKEPDPARALVAVDLAAGTLDQMSRFLADDDLQYTIRRKAQVFGALPDPLGHRRPGQMPRAPSASMVRIPDVRATTC